MSEEADFFISALENATHITVQGRVFSNGIINENSVVIVRSGIGKVNAATAAALMIERYKPDLIISTGISGGLGVSPVLSVVVGTACVQHDIDSSVTGDPLGTVWGLDKIYLEASENFVNGVLAKFPQAKKGIIASGDQFISSKARCDFIKDNFNAAACDMEAGAVAQTATLAGVPFGVIRVISDGADEDAPKSFNELVTIASKLNYEIVSEIIKG
jgi:adenosylhomocysteine nucleosidase